ncbi:hypothetical protein ARC89_04245, partial [Escherichia coli]
FPIYISELPPLFTYCVMRLLLPGWRVIFYGQTIMQPEGEVLTDHNELICSSFIEHIANTLNLGVV